MSLPFESHPIAGFAVSAVHLAIGIIVGAKKAMLLAVFPMLHIHQPPIVAELLQDGAWVMAIAAGSFTCYGIWKTHHGKKTRKR